VTPEEYAEFRRAGHSRPAGGTPRDPEADRLYQIYASWTIQLHSYVGRVLGRHIDCEFFPEQYIFKLYGGQGEVGLMDVYAFHTTPGITRPQGERTETVALPRPAEHPTKERLDQVFRELCLAAARVLEITLEKPRLEPALKDKKHAFLSWRKRRRH
jgi:hypothetical protein